MNRQPEDRVTQSPAVRIRFGRSTSQNHAAAVSLAKTFPSYTSGGEGREQWHEVCEEIRIDTHDSWQRARTLWDMVRIWNSSQIEWIDLSVKNLWEVDKKYQEISHCFHGREGSPMGEAYCSGISSPSDEASYPGCKFLVGVTLETYSGRYYGMNWFECGKFAEDGRTWLLDKALMKQTLESANARNLCKSCPHFDWARVDKELAALPDSIDIEESKSFEPVYSKFDPSKLTAIRPVSRYQNYGYRLSIGLGDEDEQDKRETLGPAKRNIPPIQYSDIAGQDRAVSEIKDVVQLPMVASKYYEQLGLSAHRGVILYGPPGNGKTLLAKAVAGECNAHFEVISGPELLSKWVGQTEQRLREVFERARQLQPSVILIDELDSIAMKREVASHEHTIQMISQLLVLMDGLEDRGQVVVIGTTNRLDAVDPAVRRSGRFDYHIELPEPDSSGREAILRATLSKMKMEDSLDLQRVAQHCEGFCGADLAALGREAGTIAIKRCMSQAISPEQARIGQADLIKAVGSLRSKREDPGNE